MMNWVTEGMEFMELCKKLERSLEKDMDRINEYAKEPKANKLLIKARRESLEFQLSMVQRMRNHHALMMIYFRDEKARIKADTQKNWNPGIKPSWEQFEEIRRASIQEAKETWNF